MASDLAYPVDGDVSRASGKGLKGSHLKARHGEALACVLLQEEAGQPECLFRVDAEDEADEDA